MENIIEELTKVNPSNLSEEGLKLFNTINEIIDKNKEYEKQLDLDYVDNNFIRISLIKEKLEELKNMELEDDIFSSMRNYAILILEEIL